MKAHISDVNVTEDGEDSMNGTEHAAVAKLKSCGGAVDGDFQRCDPSSPAQFPPESTSSLEAVHLAQVSPRKGRGMTYLRKSN